MKYQKVAGALLTVAFVIGTAATSGAAVEQPRPEAPDPTPASADFAQAAANAADAEFVRMMIPHHFQAVVMSAMAPSRSSHQQLLALAGRIEVEQDLEISMMQTWQRGNGLEVTDAEQAYQELLQDPMMLEQMGMATPEELDDLSSSTGTAFDVLYLQLMIEHHEGAIDMLVDVIINGSDATLEQWATDMLTAQYTQIQQMQAMLDELT